MSMTAARSCMHFWWFTDSGGTGGTTRPEVPGLGGMAADGWELERVEHVRPEGRGSPVHWYRATFSMLAGSATAHATDRSPASAN